MVLRFVKDKETRNTFRFRETEPSGIPTVYISKEICFAMGDPDSIELTVKAGK